MMMSLLIAEWFDFENAWPLFSCGWRALSSWPEGWLDELSKSRQKSKSGI